MTHPIYPCLWFNGQAKEAAAFYCDIFEKSEITTETPMVVTFTLNGLKFMALNGGPQYQANPAISYYVYCGGEAVIKKLYEKLSENGKVLMELGKYDWSGQYAWVSDRFGVNWQLDISDINSEQKIVPGLLFVNEKVGLVKKAISRYTGIFNPSKVLLEAPYPENASLPEGALLFAQFSLLQTVFNAMSGPGKHDFDFSPGNSFVIDCESQEEVNYYWDKLLGDGGREDRCGWLTDTFGISWQVVPVRLGELMSDPDREKAGRVMQAMLQMKKLNIAELEAAYNKPVTD